MSISPKRAAVELCTTSTSAFACTDAECANLIQLRRNDIPTWRAKLLAQQDNTCLVCQTKILKTDKAALDHQHGKKGVKIGHQKSGLVRGVLHDQCNRFEGAFVVLSTLQLFCMP